MLKQQEKLYCARVLIAANLSCSRNSRPEKPPVLKAYLDNYRREVQRYFSVPAGSPPEAFADVASNYPAFELLAE
jgi:hypothetical protein